MRMFALTQCCILFQSCRMNIFRQGIRKVFEINPVLFKVQASWKDYRLTVQTRQYIHVLKNELLRQHTNEISRTPTRGMKRLVGLHKRCADCKFTRQNGRLMVLCETHPRHNQMQWGRKGQKRLHKPYPWRWPDPFEKKYSQGMFNEDRYMHAFKDD